MLELGYENGFRVKERYNQMDGTPIVTTFSYDDDGLLSGSNRSNGVKTERQYHAAGWQSSYQEFKGGINFEHKISCNENNWQLTDYQWKAGQGKASTQYSNFTAMGLPLHQHTEYDQNTSDDLTNKYVGFQNWQLTEVAGTRHNDYGTSPYETAVLLYDVNGAVNAKLGSSYAWDIHHSNTPGLQFRKLSRNLVYFDTTSEGQVLRKLYCQYIGDFSRLNYMQKEVRYFYTVNGQYLGSYEINPNNICNDSAQMNLDYIRHSDKSSKDAALHCGNGLSSSHSRSVWEETVIGRDRDSDTLWTYTQIRIREDDRAYSYRRMLFSETEFVRSLNNPSSLPLIPPVYVVNEGDTFESIAQRFYGDSRYAGAIAEANGWIVSELPSKGEELKMPRLMLVRNSAYTARPYREFVAIIIGAIYPHLQTPQPEQDDDWFDQLISIIIVIVVAIAVPHLLPAIGSLVGLSGIAAQALTWAAYGAISSAISQGLLIGLGIQHKFSMEAVLEAGLEAGITAGFTTGGIPTELAQQVLLYGKIAVATQLSEMALGLRKQFDLGAVAGAITTQTLNAQLHLNQTADLDKLALRSVMDSTVGSLLTQGSLELRQIALQSIGTTLGTGLGQSLAPILPVVRGSLMYEEAQKAAQAKARVLPGMPVDNREVVVNHKRSLTMFNKEQVKACVRDEPLSSKPKSERDQARQIPTRAKSWQEQKQPSYADKRFKPANLHEIVSHPQIINMPSERVEGIYPEFWLMGAMDAIKLGAVGLKLGAELLEAGLTRLMAKEVAGTGLKARSLDNVETRKWYHQQLAEIPNHIDKSLSLKEQALQAFKMRNEIKIQARELMADQKLARNLPPPKTLKIAAREAYNENRVGDRFWENMIGGSQRTNKSVDDLLRVENTFAPPRNNP